MKMVIAIIQPYRLEEVKEALYAADVKLMTVSEVLATGARAGTRRSCASARESEGARR
jgi:nitrogen regulatory protein PII